MLAGGAQTYEIFRFCDLMIQCRNCTSLDFRIKVALII